MLEKMLEKLKVGTVVLLVILVSFIAFWGIFKEENGVWKNMVPAYQYGMDIEGARELKYALDPSEEEKYVYVDENGTVKGEVWKEGNATTEEDEEASSEEGQAEEAPYTKETRTIKVNSDEKLTKENFEQAKKIIQKRLKEQKVSECHIRIDDVTGNLVVETSNDNDNVSLIEDLVEKPGKFQIIDYQNGVVLMDNSDIKKASVVSSNEASYSTYLQIEFNKEGAEKLREISKKYVELSKETQTEQTTEETAEEDEQDHEEETEKKYVSIVFDDTTMMTTYFGEEMTVGMLQISVGQARTDYHEFLEDYQSAKVIADILNSGILPVTYQLETDHFVKSEYIGGESNTWKIIALATIALASIILIVKFKKNGVLAAILSIGYIAVLLVIARYTNVLITENSIVAYAIVIFMNYIVMKMLLKSLQAHEIKDAYQETMKKFYLGIVPLGVIAIIFTFSKYATINSIGMALFWGIFVNIVYHFILTKNILKKQQ